MGSSRAFRGDSYCGLYCGACEVFNLYREAQASGRPASWEDLPRELKEVIDPSPIICTGCKTEVLSPGCQTCVIRICASGKNVEACVLCPEYPCLLVAERKANITEELAVALPHIKVKFSQKEQIGEAGYGRWREEQARRWTCPDCGAAFTWYQKSCGHCGRGVEELKEHNAPSSS